MPVFQISSMRKSDEASNSPIKKVPFRLNDFDEIYKAIERVAKMLDGIAFTAVERDGLVVFTFHLTESSPELEFIFNPVKPPQIGQTLLVHVHNSEMLAKKMGEEYVRKNGGALISFANDGKREKEIGYQSVDPNQIFNSQMNDNNEYFSRHENPGKIVEVRKFAEAYGNFINRFKPDWLVALHNARDDCFYVNNIETAIELQAFHQKHNMPIPSYTGTDGSFFHSVIIITKPDTDPGLSHWALQHDIPYVNVETSNPERRNGFIFRGQTSEEQFNLPNPVRIQIAKETVESLASKKINGLVQKQK